MVAILFVLLPAAVVLGNTLSFYAQTVAQLPIPQAGILPDGDSRATRFFDNSGTRLVYALRAAADGEQLWVEVDTLPPFVVDSLVASEDSDFLTTVGFNAAEMLMALWRNWVVETAPADSVITARLVRNIFGAASELSTTRDINAVRAQEIVLAAELERRYSARELLEWHLNTNYYGNEAYGIEAAAQLYFGKRAVDLSLDEAAMLAAIPTAPQYNPFNSEMAARGRQGDVLRTLFNAETISAEAYQAAVDRVTPLVRGNFLPPVAPEFTVYARRQTAAILDSLGYDGTRLVALGGLSITTSLDLELYGQLECLRAVYLAQLATGATPSAECPAASFLPSLQNANTGLPPDTGALIVIDTRTGAIQAMIGDAVGISHPPGNMLQPFVYLTNFLDGSYTPASMVFDIPNQYPGAQEGLIYSFGNLDGQFSGPLNLRNAMGAWRIPPMIDLAYRKGMPTILQTAHQLGINSLDEARFDVMLLERGGAVSLLDMGYAFSVFSTLGDMRGVALPPVARGYRGRDPVAVLRIEDAESTVLWSYDTDAAGRCASLAVCTPILEPGAAYLVNDVLSDQETRWAYYGQGSPFDTSVTAAVVDGKAGDGARHWTMGYSSAYAVGAVLYRQDEQVAAFGDAGASEGEPLSASAPIWHALTEYIHARAGTQTTGWERPASIAEGVACEISGLLPTTACPAMAEIFLDGTQPQVLDRYWQVVEINNQTGRLANVNTPTEARSSARFFVPPDGAPLEWWVANGQPLPPTEYDDVSRPQIFETVRITRPQLFDYVGGVVDVFADINWEGVQTVQLEYGAGLNPTQWLGLGGQLADAEAGQVLQTWDTRSLDGLYSLRLVALMADNSRSSDAIQVTVDNQMPSVAINSVEVGKVYRWPSDDSVALQAEVVDNLKISRVEFYHNDEFLGADVAWPYTLDWQITGLGDHTFTAIAFDAVGNQASGQFTVDVLRSGA